MPEEVISLLREEIELSKYRIVAITFPPFAAIEVFINDIDSFVNQENCARILLVKGDVNISFKSSREFSKLHSNYISIEIGKVNGADLGETIVSSVSEDDDMSLDIIFKRIRKITVAGVYAVNEKLNKSVFAKDQRYSEGAKQFEENGGRLLAIAGGIIYHIKKLDWSA
jgi:hypothetical protein